MRERHTHERETHRERHTQRHTHTETHSYVRDTQTHPKKNHRHTDTLETR